MVDYSLKNSIIVADTTGYNKTKLLSALHGCTNKNRSFHRDSFLAMQTFLGVSALGGGYWILWGYQKTKLDKTRPRGVL
jgi:hypothetical protein